MTKYNELRQAVTDQIYSEKGYWWDLGRVCNLFTKGLISYLGCESDFLFDKDGNAHSVLSFGVQEQGTNKIEFLPTFRLPRNDKSIVFSILLHLGKIGSDKIQDSILIGVAIERDGEVYLITSSDLNIKSRCPSVEREIDMTDFFEKYNECIMNYIKS